MRPSLSLLTTNLTKSTKSSPSRLARTPKTPPLSLEHFLQRQRALSLYRTVIRSIYRIPRDRRQEPVDHARAEFERNRHVKDVGQIRYLISTGKTEFEKMERYIDELAAR